MITRFIFLMLLSVTAHAAGTDQSYSIIGRGIMDRRTGESIAIACVDVKVTTPEFELGNCTAIQHLYIDSKGAAQLVGSVYSLNGGLKKTLKLIHHAYLKARQRNASVSKYGVEALGISVSWFAIGLTFPYTVLPLLMSTPGIIAILGMMVFADYVITNDLFVFSSSRDSRVYLDQNGWNWSVQPKKKNHSRFQKYLEFIKTGNPGNVFIG